ncbi:Hypothetical protein NTJ_02632 [Nesidiocoris tenuis]|uniref:Uncharacterized protein n=1 Tax=Nesidiocoris tenuis TaxID=355587 RepID=A0ABN7AC10_9HEMI|nr:Hypothetical protein NTJ_02632 [Nesidiocoris tenuis]
MEVGVSGMGVGVSGEIAGVGVSGEIAGVGRQMSAGGGRPVRSDLGGGKHVAHSWDEAGATGVSFLQTGHSFEFFPQTMGTTLNFTRRGLSPPKDCIMQQFRGQNMH